MERTEGGRPAQEGDKRGQPLTPEERLQRKINIAQERDSRVVPRVKTPLGHTWCDILPQFERAFHRMQVEAGLPHAKIAPEVRDEVLADMNLALELFNGATQRLFDLFDWRYRWPRGLPKPRGAEVEEDLPAAAEHAGGNGEGKGVAAEAED